jgi:uncharacterized protein (TIGR03437 family)
MRSQKPALWALLLLLPTAAHAAKYCQGSYCRAYISKQPVPIVAQQTPVWCWAASLSMLFGYHGHPLQQSTIVQRYYVLPIPVTGSPLLLKDALNTSWKDDFGKSFQATSTVTDLYSLSAVQVTNADVINALIAEKPVYYGDETHAMILVQADYIESLPGFQPTVLAGWVIDPWPANLGFRQLMPHEMSARFLAVTTIRDLPNPSVPSITKVTNAASYTLEIAGQTFGSVFGSNLATATGTWDNSIVNGSLPKSLQGTRVLVNNKDAYISYASPTQVNFLAPSLTGAGPVSVTVIAPGGTATGSIALKSRSIGVLNTPWQSRQYVVAQPASSPSDLIGPPASIPGKTRAALRGEFLQVYATGLGATTPTAADGAVIKAPFPSITPSSVRVFFGGVGVTPTFVGMTYAGLFQINVQVPPGAPSGDVLLQVQIAGDISQTGVYIPIAQ